MLPPGEQRAQKRGKKERLRPKMHPTQPRRGVSAIGKGCARGTSALALVVRGGAHGSAQEESIALWCRSGVGVGSYRDGQACVRAGMLNSVRHDDYYSSAQLSKLDIRCDWAVLTSMMAHT